MKLINLITCWVLCRIFKNHRWSGWKYSNAGSCIQERVCERCHNVTEQRKHHILQPWTYQTTDSCNQVRLCVREWIIVKRREEHVWGDWSTRQESNERVRVCHRCGLEDTHEIVQNAEPANEYTGYDDVDYGDRGPGQYTGGWH